jgi:hypothetical protein
VDISELLEAFYIAVGFILISFLYVGVLGGLAHRRLRNLHRKGIDPNENPFWLERLLGGGSYRLYLFVCLMLGLGAVAADTYLPVLVTGSEPWWVKPTSSTYSALWSALSLTAILMGFLVSSRLYRYLKSIVLEDMKTKAKKTSDPDRTRRTLKMFVLVAGGSPIYQGICALSTVAFFISLHVFFIFPQWQQAAGLPSSLDLTPFLGSWSILLIYVLMTGVVGPMATAASGFAIYCGVAFRDQDVFDPLAPDTRGGFASVANLGVWSSFMLAVSPGIALPHLIFSAETYPGTLVGWGAILWLIFCMNLFFFAPLYYVHQAIKSSRQLQFKLIEPVYREKLNRFIDNEKSGTRTRVDEMVSIIALGEAYNHVTTGSDWPVDYRTFLEIAGSSMFPILSYIVSYLK